MSSAHILITGATGLLGGAVLFEALQSHPELRWTAIVRGNNEGQARARIAARLARFSNAATGSHLADRVRVIPGDLFSVGAIEPAELADVTQILHLAADTSFTSRAANWRVNFDGTLALAETAAKLPHLERFLHVGTATICGRSPPSMVYEDAYPSPDAEHLVPYTEAKASTEIALTERFPNLPVVIARPSIVAGHSLLGSRPSASIIWFVRCAQELGLVTCAADGGIDIIPSDWTASALLHLLLKPELAHRVYHLSAGTSARTTWPALARAFAAVEGGPPRYPEQFSLQRPAVLRERFLARFGRGDVRLTLMLKAVRKYFEFCSLDTIFDNSRLLAEGMAPPPSLPDYIARCIAEPAGQSIVDAFLDDMDMFDQKPPSVAAAA